MKSKIGIVVKAILFIVLFAAAFFGVYYLVENKLFKEPVEDIITTEKISFQGYINNDQTVMFESEEKIKVKDNTIDLNKVSKSLFKEVEAEISSVNILVSFSEPIATDGLVVTFKNVDNVFLVEDDSKSSDNIDLSKYEVVEIDVDSYIDNLNQININIKDYNNFIKKESDIVFYKMAIEEEKQPAIDNGSTNTPDVDTPTGDDNVTGDLTVEENIDRYDNGYIFKNNKFTYLGYINYDTTVFSTTTDSIYKLDDKQYYDKAVTNYGINLGAMAKVISSDFDVEPESITMIICFEEDINSYRAYLNNNFLESVSKITFEDSNGEKDTFERPGNNYNGALLQLGDYMKSFKYIIIEIDDYKSLFEALDNHHANTLEIIYLK